MIFKRTSFNSRLKKIIKEGFKKHTISQVGVINVTEYEAISLYEKELIGSIVFRSFWGSLEIKYLYIDENFRNQGLGKKLLEEAIKVGKEDLKCKVVYLDTLSYQALEFYKKLGFKLEFTRKGFNKGILRHYLSKEV